MQDLLKSIELKKNQREAQQKAEQIERDRRIAQETAIINSEMPERKLLAEEIFSWIKTFMATEAFSKIFYCSRYGSSFIYIYKGGGLGHEPEQIYTCCTSRVSLTKNGTLHYSSNYKWMCSKSSEYTSADELANGLYVYYLRKLKAHITSDEIYKYF